VGKGERISMEEELRLRKVRKIVSGTGVKGVGTYKGEQGKVEIKEFPGRLREKKGLTLKPHFVF
jgi:hypothetical protein